MRRYRRIQICFLILVLCFLLHKLPLSRQILHILRLKTYDLVLDFSNAFQENDEKPKIDDIVIVDIDEYSIATLGQYSTWPNLYFADLIDSLAKDSPAAIAFDIFFPEADSINSFGRQRLTEHLKSKGYEAGRLFEYYTSDADLAAAIRRAGNVYLAMFDTKDEVTNDNITEALKGWNIEDIKAIPVENPKAPIPILAQAAKGVGFAQIDTDISGLIHDYPFFFRWEDQVYVNYSFQLVLDLLQIDEIKAEGSLNLYSAGKLIRKLPFYNDESLFISYYGKPRRFRYIPFSHVLMGLVSEGYFQDKIVLVGSSTVGLRDIKPSPLGRDFPGVELHATVMQNILNEDFVRWTPNWLNWLISALLIILIAISIRHLKPHQSLLLFIASSALLGLIFLFIFYFAAIALNYSIFLSTWFLGFASLMANEFQMQYAERKKVRTAFEHYVSKSVINQIMKVDNPLKVGGSKQSASILFCDIVGFSSLCEILPVEEISELLHKHFNRCTKEITQYYGTLDKYIGDAILALYNVPIPLKEYQVNACHSALNMIKEVAELRGEYHEHPILKDFDIGIGIATGEIIAGNFGSDEIFNYTGIGDKMNLSSRLESLNRIYRTHVIIDENTYQAVKEVFLCRQLDRICVKGKDQAVNIYELICPMADATPEQTQLCQSYEAAFQLFGAQDAAAAEVAFQACLQKYPADAPSALMLHRIQTMDWSCWEGYWRYDKK